jgi:hypothetical protein
LEPKKKRGRPAKKKPVAEVAVAEEKYEGGGTLSCRQCGFEKVYENVAYIPKVICTGCGIEMRVRVKY